MALKIIWTAAVLTLIMLFLPDVRYVFFNRIGRWLYIFLLSLSLSAFLTPLARLAALRLKILDQPAQRKVHENPTPLLGGVALTAAFVLSLLGNMILDRETVVIIATGTLVAFFSIVDDWRGLQARVKLAAQILAVSFLIYQDIVLHLFPVHTTAGQVVNIALTYLWIIGLTNAMSFIDGMDGLAAGVGAIIAFFLAVVAFQTNQYLLGWISLAVMGSCLGFLPYNFRPTRPASIFLGDAGSSFLGFTLSAIAVVGDWSDNNPIVSFAAPLLIFWVLIFDMTYITVERIVTGKVKTFRQWLEYAGKDHLHHRMYNLLGDKRKAVLFIYLLSFTLGISAIALRNARSVDGALLVIQAFLITVIVSIMDYSGRHR